MRLGTKVVVAVVAALLATAGCRGESEPEAAAAPQEAEAEAVAAEPAEEAEAGVQPPIAEAPPPPRPEGLADPGDAMDEWIIWADADPWDGPAPLTVEFECDLMEEVPDPTFEWDFGDGSEFSTESHPTHTYAKPGRYAARCQVTDPSGMTGEDWITIEVDPPLDEAAPQAEAAEPAEEAEAAEEAEEAAE